MKYPKLVVMTGVIGSGKTYLSKVVEAGEYARLSGDETLARSGGPDWYGKLTNDQIAEVFAELYRERDQALREGRNVVFDSTAYNNWKRQEALGTVPCEKYLLWVQADPDIRKQAIQERVARGIWKPET